MILKDSKRRWYVQWKTHTSYEAASVFASYQCSCDIMQRHIIELCNYLSTWYLQANFLILKIDVNLNDIFFSAAQRVGDALPTSAIVRQRFAGSIKSGKSQSHL